ncbi:G-type lectin S-receptor-like serine/threonine-protein kinase, partial [Tanacetum coccineum]
MELDVFFGEEVTASQMAHVRVQHGFSYFVKSMMLIVEEEKRKRDEYFLELTASDSFKDVHHLESNAGKGTDLLIFSFASTVAATNDFSIENKLGQGGFGPVFK